MLYPPPSKLTQGPESRRYLCSKPQSARTLQGTFLIQSHSVLWHGAAHTTGTAWGVQPCAGVTPPSTSPAFPKHAPFSQQMRSTNSFKLAYVLRGDFSQSMESILNGMQFKVVVYCPGWMFLARQMCKLRLRYTLLTVNVSRISHLTQGLDWLAHGFSKRKKLVRCGCLRIWTLPLVLPAYTLIKATQEQLMPAVVYSTVQEDKV